MASHWTASPCVRQANKPLEDHLLTCSTLAAGIHNGTAGRRSEVAGTGRRRGTDADRENGPAARSFAADAHDCIMVRIQTEPAVYKFGGARLRPNGELPSDPQQTRHRQTPKLCKKPLSQFIIPPRAQASKPAPGLNRGRCETQAPLSGKPLSCASVSVPGPLPRAPGTWLQATWRRTAFRSEQRTGKNPNLNSLTGKAPYKFESIFLQRCVSHEPVPRRPIGPSRTAVAIIDHCQVGRLLTGLRPPTLTSTI